MIHYGPCEKTRNEKIVMGIMQEASCRSFAAELVHFHTEGMMEALHLLRGGHWTPHIDYDTDLVSFSRDLS